MNTDRREDLLRLLYRPDPSPAELLEQFDARRVVQRGRRMRSEEQLEAFPIRQCRRARSVGQLEAHVRKRCPRYNSHVKR